MLINITLRYFIRVTEENVTVLCLLNLKRQSVDAGSQLHTRAAMGKTYYKYK